MTKLPGAIWNVARGSAWRPPRSGGEAQDEPSTHGYASIESIGSTICTSLRAFWRGLRAVMGDDAYERYIEHHAARHPGAAPLSRRAFYEAEQKRQWSRINRCC